MKNKLYIIAGPNGAGKTTLAHELVKDENITFLNADEIAVKCHDDVGLKSGRILLEKFDKLITKGESFQLHDCCSSSLMRAISGLIFPTEGSVFIDGKELGKDFSFPDNMGLLIENPAFLSKTVVAIFFMSLGKPPFGGVMLMPIPTTA